MIRGVLLAWWLLVVSLATAGVSGSGHDPTTLRGAGATFPYPFYLTVFDLFSRRTGITVEYAGTGSEDGLRQFVAGKVDFAGTDVFMTADERRKAGGPVVHVPTCVSAVAITCNLSGREGPRLTPDTLADIFLGRIQYWNDPRLAAVNPGRQLPAMRITVVHRSDGSGTTHILSEYLSKVSADWRQQVGTGRTLRWPVGTGVPGNPGVAGLVHQRPGAIGYVELTYALGNDLTRCAIRNRAGRFVIPTPDAVSRAAEVPLPADTNVSLTDTSAPGGYPISGLTWIVLRQELATGGRSLDAARALTSLVWWVTHEGQGYATDLGYAPLSPAAAARGEALIRSLTYRGKPLLLETATKRGAAGRPAC
jgi:phosphate transport system substrate-binding protein